MTARVLPQRPMLGAVLDALTVPRAGDPPPSIWCDVTDVPVVVRDSGCVVEVGSPYHGVRYPWATQDPAEALELLQARDIVPMNWRGRFVCEACGGTGGIRAGGSPSEPDEWDHCPDCAVEDPDATGGVRAVGTLPHPPTVAALASWASLGFAAGDDGTPGILGIEEVVRRDAWMPAPLSWQVAAVTLTGVTDGRVRWRLQQWGCDVRELPTSNIVRVPPLGAQP